MNIHELIGAYKKINFDAMEDETGLNEQKKEKVEIKKAEYKEIKPKKVEVDNKVKGLIEELDALEQGTNEEPEEEEENLDEDIESFSNKLDDAARDLKDLISDLTKVEESFNESMNEVSDELVDKALGKAQREVIKGKMTDNKELEKKGKKHLKGLKKQAEKREKRKCESLKEELTDYDDPQGRITLRDAKREFEKLVKEADDIYWQSYKFIDITGLENACPAFTCINWEDIPELIRSWGFTVYEDEIEEPAIALSKDITEDDLKQMIQDFNAENGFDGEDGELMSSENESLNEEVVAKFDNGKHEIVKCKEGYYNRYNIKEGKARFTTKCVESLPTALGALKKRFPQAEEVK